MLRILRNTPGNVYAAASHRRKPTESDDHAFSLQKLATNIFKFNV